MKIRLHRGTYSESMETCEDIENTEKSIRDYLARRGSLFHEQIKEIVVKFYCKSDRGWGDDFIILADGTPIAFCSSLITEEK